jgi:hypothetical protein
VDTPAPVELVWTQESPGAQACIDRAALASKVEQIVGRHVFAGEGRGQSVIRGEIGPWPGHSGWLAIVEARTASAVTLRRELTLDAHDCKQLDGPITLVVALMVDSSEKEAPLALPAPAQPVTVGVGADTTVAYGLLPGAAVGFGLATDLYVPPLWPVMLSTHFWPLSQVVEEGSGGRLGAWSGGGALCPLVWTRYAWSAYGCAGATGAVIESNGVGLDLEHSHTRPYLQADARAGLRLRIAGPLFLAVEAEGGFPFSRDSYSYVDSNGVEHKVFQTAPVVPSGHARLELRVP